MSVTYSRFLLLYIGNSSNGRGLKMSNKEKIITLLENANDKQLERLWYFVKAYLS